MPKSLAIIGGTGLTQLPGLTISSAHDVQTPFGSPSAPILEGQLEGQRILFLARHGHPHRIAPHKVNYRANLWALQNLYATDIIAVNAVGAIAKGLSDCDIVVPDQIIDYTSGRNTTFFDGEQDTVRHADLSYPYTENLRHLIIDSAQASEIETVNKATYGVTQGPRLETAAEITRMERDGCDIVGMTGMPEAVLARELQLNYASLCLVVNPAAGKSDKMITLKQINEALDQGMSKVYKLSGELIRTFYGS